MINILLFKFCWHYFQALSLHLLTKLLAFFSEFVPTPFTPFTIDINMFNNEYFEWKVSNITLTPMWPTCVRVHPNLINDLLLLLFCLRRLPSPALSRATFPLVFLLNLSSFAARFVVFSFVFWTLIVLCWILQFCSPYNIATWVFTELSHRWSNLALLVQFEFDRAW